MTQIERRARIIRKARRIVILLLIGVTIAIALIDITEEQHQDSDIKNTLVAEKDDVQKKKIAKERAQIKSSTVKKENPQNDKFFNKKAKNTLELKNAETKKQVVSVGVEEDNKKIVAVENVDVEDVSDSNIGPSKETLLQEPKKKSSEKPSKKNGAKETVKVKEKTQEPTLPQKKSTEIKQKNRLTAPNKEFRDFKEYDETNKVADKPKRGNKLKNNAKKNESIADEATGGRQNVAYQEVKPKVKKSGPKQLVDSKASEYIVQPNDTISHIALFYYGKGKSYYWKYIADYNNISHEKRLKINQHLYIPSLAFIEKHYVVKKIIAKLHKKTNEYIYYIVQKGDNLNKIAQQNKTSPERLFDCNSWLKVNPKIKTGMILRVPKTKKLARK
ncbi:LysM peptidoglycan-binding domain-containing protein [Candidatus Uabimicrobium sp. HlEnr_7]|uniref:LysM peptidoglycan-binding domain-containing protein n=1 Tax=Candidatus Uabimicrobium helgolandensis TaxID=3095367 RepID=UPI0035573C3C